MDIDMKNPTIIRSKSKNQYTCKTHIKLLNGGYRASVIKLDPGCDVFGKTVFLRGGSISVMYDYIKKCWLEYSVEGE